MCGSSWVTDTTYIRTWQGWHIYKTRELARADIFDYIDVFHNRTRRHSHLGGVSPDAFEQAAS